MAPLPILKYSHHTLVFYPLRNPEIPERKHLVDDNGNESSRYLRQRPKGFMFLRWLQHDPKIHPDASVGLFASVDRPQELVAIKKLSSIMRSKLAADDANPMPAEIEQSTLSEADPHVQRRLPLSHGNMELTPFPQLHAFQVHHRGSIVAGDDDEGETGLPYRDADVTLIYKYYNGGTLHNLKRKYEDAGKKVPEGFIWHLISQVGRALSWMHTGHIPSPGYNLAHQNDIGAGEITVNLAAKDDNWDPICHMDMHANNIWLHYPSDEEKKADPRLAKFTDELPQIILGDFGFSFQASNDRADMLCGLDNPGIPEPETIMDKMNLGHSIWTLLKIQISEDERARALQQRQAGPNPLVRTDYYDLSEWMRHNYSKDLEDCWERFPTLVALDHTSNWFDRLLKTTDADWSHFPRNNFTYGTMIAMADRYLARNVEGGKEESVRWTQPSNSHMPYHSIPRLPKQHRWDWGRVDGHLDKQVMSDLNILNRNCIRIRQAPIVGAGTPEKELDRVDFENPMAPKPSRRTKDPKKDPKTPMPPQPAPQGPKLSVHSPTVGPDDLPDYESEDEQNAGAIAAYRATVGPHEARDSSPSSALVPEEYLARERYGARVYARRCRERGLVERVRVSTSLDK